MAKGIKTPQDMANMPVWKWLSVKDEIGLAGVTKDSEARFINELNSLKFSINGSEYAIRATKSTKEKDVRCNLWLPYWTAPRKDEENKEDANVALNILLHGNELDGTWNANSGKEQQWG